MVPLRTMAHNQRGEIRWLDRLGSQARGACPLYQWRGLPARSGGGDDGGGDGGEARQSTGDDGGEANAESDGGGRRPGASSGGWMHERRGGNDVGGGGGEGATMGAGGVDDAEEAMAPPQMVGGVLPDCMCMWASRRHVAGSVAAARFFPLHRLRQPSLPLSAAIAPEPRSWLPLTALCPAVIQSC